MFSGWPAWSDSYLTSVSESASTCSSSSLKAVSFAWEILGLSRQLPVRAIPRLLLLSKPNHLQLGESLLIPLRRLAVRQI